MEEIRMNIKNNKNCKITINDEVISVSEKEKTADELFKELGYKKLEDKYNIDYNKIYSFTNGDKIKEQIRFCKLDEYIHIENYNFDDGITFGKFLDTKELQAINKKCKELRLDMIETETGKVLNKLAREQFKSKLLAEILIDLQVCKLENLNPKEYIEELKQEIDNIYERFNNENE